MKKLFWMLLPAMLLAVILVFTIVLRPLIGSGRRSSSEEASADKPQYSESPILQDRVKRGELPPVEERLPENPLVVKPVDSIGRYDSEPRKPQSP